MQLFECQGCNSALHFENSQCLTCKRRVGFLQDRFVMSAVEGGPESYQPLAFKNQSYRYCGNAQYGVCNWLIPETSGERLCEACRHNRTIPDLAVPQNIERWAKIELAKRYLFRSILRWDLPHPNKTDDPEHGLAFDFLSEAPGAAPVMTGHDDGLITLNIAEGDDAEREKRRAALGEPYRTLVGHFRHEIGHYYWDALVRDRGGIDAYRAAFGDESVDYGESLKRHYGGGPPVDWSTQFISSYASAHPWEDFAETWAHYLHIVDALETARSYGIDVRARFIPNAAAAKIDFHPYSAPSAERLIDAWVPLTVALNGVNRSMGHADLYPFVLSEPVMKKLQYVHDLIRGARGVKISAEAKPAAA